MEYNDFQVLNNEDYMLIKSQYEKDFLFDRTTHTTKILAKLNSCICFCRELSGKYNIQIQRELNSTHETLRKLENNLMSIFKPTQHNPKPTNQRSLKPSNIFNLIKSLNDIIKSLLDWKTHETKQYYKTISNKTIYEILNVLKNILTSMENSKIDFYRHM